MKRTKRLLVSIFAVLFVFNMTSFSSVLTEDTQMVSAQVADSSVKSEVQELETLISELIYYYGENAQTDVLRTLDEIKEISEEEYELWNSVIKEWDWIENDMYENIDVAPDGLPTDDSHVFIVLGFALAEDGQMKDELVGRLEVALNSAKKYPESYVLVTGGVEKNGWTEGERMHDWLVENGLSEDRIIVEKESTKTVENADFSYEILYNDYDIKSVSLITSQYHLKRGSIFYYTMSLLKARELNKTPIEFLSEGNAGWYRADKTEEPMTLKARGMAQIAGVPIAQNLPISQLQKLNIEGDFVYNKNEDLNLKVLAQYDNGYIRNVTDHVNISGFDSSTIGEKMIEISYSENDKVISESITVTVLENPLEAAGLVDRMIYRLPNVGMLTLEDAESVEAARAAYEDLSEEAKTYVKNLEKLELRENRIAALDPEGEEVADKFAVRELQRRIYRLPNARTITLDDAPQVEAVRAEYEALNEASKEIFSPQYLKNLELRETKLEEMAAKEVDRLVAKFKEADEVTEDYRIKVSTARAAYDALSEEAKMLVHPANVGKLERAEAKITEADNMMARKMEMRKFVA